MRLGLVMTGVGAHGAAGIGVMEELWRRQLEPCAVCGLGAGAWPAALFAAGCDAPFLRRATQQAARMGPRLLGTRTGARRLLRGRRDALCGGEPMQRLLTAQTGGRILALCSRPGIFPVRMARREQPLVFSTKAFDVPDGGVLTMQASVSFAARAAMALPPFLAPMGWMGAPLLPIYDEAFAARMLLAMGAQRVLIVRALPSPRRAPDALEAAALCLMPDRRDDALPPGAAVLHVPMPDDTGALALNRLTDCADRGKKAAERELDLLFEHLGMAFCRILPFRREGS